MILGGIEEAFMILCSCLMVPGEIGGATERK